PSRPGPSAAYRGRSRERFAALIQADTRRPPSAWFRRRAAVCFYLRAVAAPLAASLLLLLGATGVLSASAAALPDTPLYPAKLAFEQLTILTAWTSEQKARSEERRVGK